MAEKEKWERIYTISLSGMYAKGRHVLRSANATAEVKEFVARHAKVDKKSVSISEALNSEIWSFGGQKPPKRLKVRIAKAEGKAKATLLGEEEERKKKEAEQKKKAAAKGKKPEARKEEKKPEPKKEEEKPHAAKQREETPEEKEQREKLEKVAEKASM